MQSKFIAMAIIFLSVLSVDASAQVRNLHSENRRIRQGVRSGELTGRETAGLKMQEAHIKKEAIKDKANDGRIGPHERAHLRKDKRRLDRNIYRQKHDAQTRP